MTGICFPMGSTWRRQQQTNWCWISSCNCVTVRHLRTPITDAGSPLQTNKMTCLSRRNPPTMTPSPAPSIRFGKRLSLKLHLTIPSERATSDPRPLPHVSPRLPFHLVLDIPPITDPQTNGVHHHTNIGPPPPVMARRERPSLPVTKIVPNPWWASKPGHHCGHYEPATQMPRPCVTTRSSSASCAWGSTTRQ